MFSDRFALFIIEKTEFQIRNAAADKNLFQWFLRQTNMRPFAFAIYRVLFYVRKVY